MACAAATKISYFKLQIENGCTKFPRQTSIQNTSCAENHAQVFQLASCLTNISTMLWHRRIQSFCWWYRLCRYVCMEHQNNEHLFNLQILKFDRRIWMRISIELYILRLDFDTKIQYYYAKFLIKIRDYNDSLCGRFYGKPQSNYCARDVTWIQRTQIIVSP